MKLDVKQLEFMEARLRTLLIWIEAETGYELTITSLYRIKDDGVHGTLPLRGTDLRVRSYPAGKALEILVNDRWVYDPTRPDKKCAVLHGAGAKLHLHLQVHGNTRLLV